MNSLEQTIKEISAFLDKQKIPYMVIGGVANLVWGVPRTTLDIDITVLVQEGAVETFLNKAVRSFRCRSKNPADFVTRTGVLPLTSKAGMNIDLIFGKLAYEEQAVRRAKKKKMGAQSVRVCSAEDLIVHKIISQRPKDLEDVKGIIQQQKSALDRKYLDPIVENLAKELVRNDILEFYKRCFR